MRPVAWGVARGPRWSIFYDVGYAAAEVRDVPRVASLEAVEGAPLLPAPLGCVEPRVKRWVAGPPVGLRLGCGGCRGGAVS